MISRILLYKKQWYDYSCMNKTNRKNENHLRFYSDEMFVTEKFLTEHLLKLTYQRKLFSNLDSKHKEWSRSI